MNEDMTENEIKPDEMDFITWLAEVDQSTWLTIGCSIHDLRDCLLRDWYDMGVSSSGDAVDRAIEENFPEFFERVPQFPKAFPKFPKSHGDIGRTASYMASMRMTLEK